METKCINCGNDTMSGLNHCMGCYEGYSNYPVNPDLKNNGDD